MSSIVVRQLEPHHFAVEVAEKDVATRHKVAVRPELLDEHGLARADEADVVREAMAFLLERLPASAIQGDFPLEQLGDHYAEFWDELSLRLS